MNIRARKVLRDIWSNKARTALVIASIAVGLMAISATFRAQAIFSQSLADSLAAINPASARLLTLRADEDAVTAVQNLPAIQAAEGRQIAWARILVGDNWRSLKLAALPDFDDIQIDKITSTEGDWPPPERSLLIERSSMNAAGVNLGDTVRIKTSDGVEKELPVAGLAHDLTIVSGELLDQVVFGYTSLETLLWLGLPDDYNEIKLTVAENPMDETHIQQAAQAAGDAIEDEGAPMFGARIPTPGKHLMDNVVQSLLLILGSLGALSMLLSAFLVFNTVSALLVRQVPQIGVMKAIGAPQRDILTMYLSTILIFSGVALATAVPLGMVGARVMTTLLAKMLNFDISGFRVPPTIWLLELGVGLIVPLAAALAPILNGTRITVREAMGSQGGGQFGAGRIDRWLSKLRGLPASASYAARNIFRRKLRLAITLVTLSLGGAIFITVLSVQSSLFLTLEGIAAYWQQDVAVNLARPYRLRELDPIITAVPEVTAVEGWSVRPAFLLRDDGTESKNDITLFAIPPDSQFVEPTLLDGRWLKRGDTDAVVINIDLALAEPDIGLDDWVTLRINGRESDWRVVGKATTQMVGLGEPRPEIPMAYVPYQQYAAVAGQPGRFNRIAVAGSEHTPDAQIALSRQLDAQLRGRDIHVRSLETYTETRTQAENLMTPILLLLISMAALFALVGGLSLAGTMSLNVLERTQEIGIIRAIGAASGSIMQIVIIEGVFVGLLSWLLAAILAYPMGWVMSTAVGVSFIKIPLAYDFAPLGILLWLLIVIILAIIASYIPARNASRLIVRHALAYE
ncbi:MAG: ABC transporter permease [Chloroflexi bacterium]|nr:ABC transporter permease [Chloroflexota bacterium]